MKIYSRLFTSIISVFSLVLLCAGLSHAQQWTGILNSSRAINWNNVGVTGGIPTNRTQCVTSACATVTTNGASSTSAEIEAAWASAPANTYVLLPAGTYSGVTSLSLSGVSNVTLRGAGANQTIIPGPINLTSSDGNSNFSVKNGPVLVSGNVARGSSTITLASVPNLKVGNPIILDQLDSTTDNGGVLVLGTSSSYTGPFVAPGNGGPYSIDGEMQNARCPGNYNDPANCFHQEQIVFVAQCDGVTTAGHACSSGSNITFNPPLGMSNWSTANSMSAWWDTLPIQYSGIEDLTSDNTNSSGSNGITLSNCSNCWVKGVAVIDTNLAHVQANWGANDSVTNSYFFLTQNHVTSSYGVVCNSATGMLIENNIFHAIASPVIWNGTCSGSVVGYNYAINNYYTESPGYNQNFYGEHSGGVDTNLLEGNIANQADADNIHGTGNLDTFFRNDFLGPLPACYASGSTYATSTYEQCNNPGANTPVPIWSYHRFYNVIGNVLGTSGVNTAYENSVGSACTPTSCILQTGIGDTVPADPSVLPTAMIWGNADSANGFGSPRFNCSEVPTALTGVQAPYSNPCPSSHTLPASFYYASQPSWWPSGKSWPLIGPDVTGGNLLLCTGGTQTRALVTTSTASACTSAGGTTSVAMGGLSNSNPAMDCYLSLGGLPNGTGLQLTNFSESSCYSGTVSTNPPQPPTNVKATAQ
jgi:hypothetical protein